MLAIAAGGGLAGAAFAIAIARGGGRARLVERSAGAHHKVCGEFLSGNAVALLRGLGVDVWQLGACRVERLSLADGAAHATAPLPFVAAGLSRFRLDEALLIAAQAAGVEVMRGVTVDGIDAGGGQVAVQTSRGVLLGDVVALASGKHNVRGVARPAGPMAGFKMQVEPTAQARRAMDGRVQLIAIPGGYGGFCLVEDGVLSIAWNVRREMLRSIGPGWAAQAALLAEAAPAAAELLAGARPLWDKPLAVSGLPYGFLRKDAIARNVYAVGDQMAVIPSFTGDGTALALASGIAAARAALSGESAAEFQRRMARGRAAQFRLATALDYVIARPGLRRAALKGAQWLPAVVTGLVAATRLRGFDDVFAAPGDTG